MGEKFDWGTHRIEGEDVHLAGWGTHPSLQEAEAYCTLVAGSHYENFLIANYFTPAEVRQHIENIYAFCRYGDDLGDDAPFDTEGRLTLLNAWQHDLESVAEGHWSGTAHW